jgi:predicted DNA-binding protein
VRKSIGLFLESPDEPSLRLTPRALEILGKLAEESPRSLAQLIEECIEGIFTLVEDDRSPLIVEEIKLRRSYRRVAGKSRSKK